MGHWIWSNPSHFKDPDARSSIVCSMGKLIKKSLFFLLCLNYKTQTKTINLLIGFLDKMNYLELGILFIFLTNLFILGNLVNVPVRFAKSCFQDCREDDSALCEGLAHYGHYIVWNMSMLLENSGLIVIFAEGNDDSIIIVYY